MKAQYSGKKIKISTELFNRGCVSTAEQGLLAAAKIGFPVMIKASEGGGGKGIRRVDNSEEFPGKKFACCVKNIFFYGGKK